AIEDAAIFVIPAPAAKAVEDRMVGDVRNARDDRATGGEDFARAPHSGPRIDHVLEDVGEDDAIRGGPTRRPSIAEVPDVNVVEDGARAGGGLFHDLEATHLDSAALVFQRATEASRAAADVDDATRVRGDHGRNVDAVEVVITDVFFERVQGGPT